MNFTLEDNFKEELKLAEGRLDDGELGVYSFLVNKDLSERSAKKAQYELGKKILKNEQKDAGIFIFYDKSGNFRFSLIYTNYLGKKRDWSNFRRFSYFVSKELTNKTFLQRIGEGDLSNLEKIKEAFSVEKVTKEFYQEIANWYFWAVQESKFPPNAEKEKNGRNIAVIRLITRMIFIWFMKVRGLIPEELFNINKIKEILKDVSFKESTYYKAILQNLFFATLNTKQKERRFRSQIRGYKGFNPDFGNHNVYRYQDLFKDPEKIKDYFGGIPFLNGGLFECLDYKSPKKQKRFYIDGFTDLKQYQPYVPNFLFFSDETNIDLNKEYGTKEKSYKVRGLINILSSYNFTIDENEPDDLEVALDPELLGRVFENLLASYNPETATTARKATGSYNTPREIVDYMVSQSLIYYFKTHLNDVKDIDDKLTKLFSKETNANPFDEDTTLKIISLIESLRIVDPAVGSGAFPMGILNKLVFVLSKIDPQNKLWKQAQIEAIERDIKDHNLKETLTQQIEKYFRTKDINYLRKLYLIEKCIYGVDIQQIAIEIAKLRFFISLLVDEKIDKTKENWAIEPLPNLDFKLMQGNSLIEKINPEFLFCVGDQVRDKLVNNLRELKEEFFRVADNLTKKDLKEKINSLIIEIAEYDKKKNIERLKARITSIKSQLKLFYVKEIEQKEQEEILEIEKEIKELKDAKITGPDEHFEWHINFAEVFSGENPGFDIVIGNPPYIKEYTFREVFNGLRDSPYYKGKMDIWYMFACKGIDLLKRDTGILTFIAQNNWVTSYGASIMRNKVIRDTQILQMLDFGDYKIFESSDIQTMIMVFKNDSRIDNYKFDYRKLEGEYLKFNDVLDLLNRNPNPQTIYLEPIIDREKFLDKPLTFNILTIDEILDKLSIQSNFKIVEKEITNGIHSHHDCVTKDMQKKLGDKFRIGEGIFVLSNKEKNNIPFTQKELELIKPYYTTKELGRYYANKNNSYWIIYTDSKFKYPENIKPYPNIKKHLDKFQRVITSDNKPYGLHRARDEYFFKGEKIIAVRKCKEPIFTYTDFDCYVSAAFYIIKTQKINLKYLTAILNSKLIAFWLRYKGKMQGNNYQIDKEPLLALPLRNIPDNDQQPFIALVDKILSLTKDNDYSQNPQKQTQVKEYERQIDQLVYKLYDLTEGEIKIVEEFNKEVSK